MPRDPVPATAEKTQQKKVSRAFERSERPTIVHVGVAVAAEGQPRWGEIAHVPGLETSAGTLALSVWIVEAGHSHLRRGLSLTPPGRRVHLSKPQPLLCRQAPARAEPRESPGE